MSSDFSIQKQAQRLCIYIDESDRWRGKPLYAAILETLKANGVAGATVVRGVAGFGAHSRIRTAAILRLSEDLPLRIEVIDAPEKIVQAVDLVAPMVREGLVTLEEVQVVRYTHRYLNPLPADKPLEEVMTTEVITLEPGMSIASAWELMLETGLKALPVIDERRQVVGLLTDEDLIHRAGLQQHLSVALRMDPAARKEQLAALRASPLTVARVMSQPAIVARLAEPLGVAAARMARHEIKRLPVVDESGALVGVVSRVDILRQVINLEPKKADAPLPRGALLTVDQVMAPVFPVVAAQADFATIVAQLVETGMRRLVVVDAANHPLGLISDSDVVSRLQPSDQRKVIRALQGGQAFSSQLTAEDLMSRGVLTAPADTPLVEAAQQMLTQRRKWLVVVDAQGRALGLVDRQVLLKAVTAG